MINQERSMVKPNMQTTVLLDDQLTLHDRVECAEVREAALLLRGEAVRRVGRAVAEIGPPLLRGGRVRHGVGVMPLDRVALLDGERRRMKGEAVDGHL